jgi:hypothetical protein
MEATNASSGSTHAGFDQGTGTTEGDEEAGTDAPPSNSQVCSREYLPFRKSLLAPLQRITAVWLDMVREDARFPPGATGIPRDGTNVTKLSNKRSDAILENWGMICAPRPTPIMNILSAGAGLLLASSVSAVAAPLVNYNDTWRYKKGTSAPQANWKSVADASLEASWLSGTGWIGFGDGSGVNAAGTTLSDMRMTGTNAGYRMVYLRKTFTVTPSVPGTDEVVLDIDFDDGFIAWIDGVYVDHFGPSGSPPAEPAWNAAPSLDLHECSFGNSSSSPQPVRSTVLGTVSEKLPVGTHVLSVLLMNESIDSSDAVARINLSTRVPPPPPDLHWELSDSPVVLTSTFNIIASQELIIDPGVEVRCHSGSDAIDCAGKITSIGTEAQPIRFVRANAANSWNRIRITGTQESNFKWCVFDGSNTSGTIRGSGSSSASPSVNLEKCKWINTDVQMVDLTYTSCNIIDCEFESIGPQELIHFSNMPATGHALIKGCLFGTPGTLPTTGYNDVVDFTGGNRPGPIARFIDNIFLACVEDCFDMDATDAHVEGNLFLNVQQDAPRASSSNPITTGEGNAIAELVICRNFFYNCEHLLLLKDSGAAVLQNNSFLKMVQNPNALQSAGGPATPPGIILFGEPWRGRPLGAGAIYSGNIAWDLAPVIQTTPFPLFSAVTSYLVADHSLIQGNQWPGTGNITADPLFVSTTGVEYTNIRQKLVLQAGSPAKGTGPNGIDMGAAVPAGASVSGEPTAVTSSRNATLSVGGPGIWAYKWRLNGGAWSADIPLVSASVLNGGPFTATMYDNPTPITLINLANGTYSVEVLGRNSAGDWQETPVVSKSWTVEGVSDPDTDSDGIPDAWEIANGLDEQFAGDADLDADGDTASNRGEYIAGTNPQNAASRLAATAVVQGDGSVNVTFDAVIGKSYRIESSPSLTAASWTTVTVLPAQSATGPVTVPDPSTSQRKFYRVVTPAQ